MVPINYLAVVVAAVANMVIGMMWYGPIFGKPWVKLAGITSEKIAEAKKKGMAKEYVLAFVGALLMSYVLSHVIIFGMSYMNVSGISAGFSSAFWVWLGFFVPVTMSAVLWDGKPWKLWLINSSYYLVTLLVMGAILASWM